MTSNAAGDGDKASPGYAKDFLASFVVFLVALPLCIGIAVAVGVNPARALITGIIGGIVVGAIAGCPLQVSGPAAGLFVIVADFLSDRKLSFLATSAEAVGDVAAQEARAAEYALTALGACVLLAGVMQFIAGRLKLGQWFRAVSPAVIEGMLAGIGVLIFASQFHVMLDYDPLYEGRKAQGGIEYLMAIPQAVSITVRDFGAHGSAASVGLLAIFSIIAWQKFSPRSLKFVPAPLVGVVAGTLLASTLHLDVRHLAVAANLLDEVTIPTITTWRLLLDAHIWGSAVVIAIIASAETLLCATAVDKMQHGPRTNYDRELCAQGFGNMLCGLLGALPMTGVIVRSSANVQAGARTRLSTILHGAWLLIFVVVFPQVLGYMPKAALGAVLVLTGLKLIKLRTLKEYWQLDGAVAFIFLTTMTVIVAKDLLLGVAVGMALSTLKIFWRVSQLDVDLRVTLDDRRGDMKLRGAATFLRLPLIAKTLERMPAGADLYLDVSELTYIDHAVLDLITEWSHQQAVTCGRLIVDWDLLHARFQRHALPGVEANGAEGPQPIRDGKPAIHDELRYDVADDSEALKH